MFKTHEIERLENLNKYEILDTPTFCIIDKHPRTLTVQEGSVLRHLARIVVNHLELRFQARMLMRDLKGVSRAFPSLSNLMVEKSFLFHSQRILSLFRSTGYYTNYLQDQASSKEKISATFAS